MGTKKNSGNIIDFSNKILNFKAITLTIFHYTLVDWASAFDASHKTFHLKFKMSVPSFSLNRLN